MLNPIAYLIYQLLGLYIWVVIVAVVASWLIAFNIINLHNNFVRQVMRVVDALTEPVFRKIRQVIPPVGGLDLSPLVVFFVIMGLQYTMTWGPVLATGF